MSVLSLALIMGLATDPACGAAASGSEFASRLQAIAVGESGGDPFAIRVNGPGGGPRHFPNAALAATAAMMLDAAGRDYDAGLLQINRRQFARHGLTRATAFNPCQSMKAGAEHYADDVRAASIFSLAHRRYNTGGFERGAAYAASIERILTRSRSAPAAAPPSPAAMVSPLDPFVRPAPGRALTFN